MSIYAQKCLLSNGVEIRCDEGTPLEILAKLAKDMFEEEVYTRGFVDVAPMETILDLGANIGLFSIFAARRAPAARIISLEASRENFAQLRANLGANGIKNVSAHHLAVSGSMGTVELTVDPHSTCHRAVETANPEFAGRATRVDRIEAVSLDALFDRFGIVTCDLLKMDIEGSEYGVFFAASDPTLAKIKAIAMEYHDYLVEYTGEDMRAFLVKKGFDVRLVQNGDHGMIYASRRP